ncbi:PilT protein-like [Olavius sp. associated proteobacterium Delta 1]|nr:PilT protein-like [Olavius sp. associated proteobacterium Delta 1]
MIAVDTNLLVRILTNDDPNQADRAVKLMKSGDIFIPKTVLLETEWVLRHAYGIGKSKIINGFQKLLGLPNVNIEDPDCIYQAIAWYENKFDFADALHLASSRRCESFATFDSSFNKKAKQFNSMDMINP